MYRERMVKELVFLAKRTPDLFIVLGKDYHYKRICIDTDENGMNVYDTSTDLWRPLTTGELEQLKMYGLKEFNFMLKEKNLQKTLVESRHEYHIASVKKNGKEMDFLYKKVLGILKKLRSMRGY